MALRVVYLGALTAGEVSPTQVASLVVFLVVSINVRKVPVWRWLTNKKFLF